MKKLAYYLGIIIAAIGVLMEFGGAFGMIWLDCAWDDYDCTSDITSMKFLFTGWLVAIIGLVVYAYGDKGS